MTTMIRTNLCCLSVRLHQEISITEEYRWFEVSFACGLSSAVLCVDKTT